ncbi:MAG: hypothetical protein Q7O66_19555 [Dehalococcoidia bacterium]|nr:hypothetical protein [Dehalococcoidia bacterium]
MHIQLSAVFQKVLEGYMGFVEELPGANTQGDTLEETERTCLTEPIMTGADCMGRSFGRPIV